MKSEDLLKKYRRRLAAIGWGKALLYSAIAGLCVSGAAGLATWFTHMELWIVLLLSLGLGAAVVLLCAPVIYLKFFRPTTDSAAAQIDALGLEERMITMRELENDPSEIAALQRKDATARLRAVSEKRLRFSVAMPFFALLACSFLFAASFVTVSALAAGGMIGRGDEVLGVEGGLPQEETPPETVTYTVKYLVYEEGTGVIDGEAVQTVKKGGFTKAVTAVPAEGYLFYAWVDAQMHPIGNQENPRIDLNVRADTEVYACFYKAEEGNPDDDPSEGEGELPGGDDSGEEGGGGEDGEGGPGSAGSSGEVGGDGSEAEGRLNNSVIDGNSDYKENFDREKSEKELAEDDTLPDELKDILGDYYNALKP